MASVEVEITEIPPLSPGESSLLDMHTLLNVLNVLYGELSLLGLTLGDDPELLRPALVVCDRFKADLGNPAASHPASHSRGTGPPAGAQRGTRSA